MAVADFTNPKLTQDYTTLLQSIRDANTSQALMHDGTGIVNVPTGTIRWSSANNRDEKFNGSAWVAKSSTYSIDVASVGGLVPSNAAIFGTIVTRDAAGFSYISKLNLGNDFSTTRVTSILTKNESTGDIVKPSTAAQVKTFLGYTATEIAGFTISHGLNGDVPSLSVGNNALNSTTTATGNTALGYYALQATTTGGDNVAIGANASFSNMSGTGNVAVGAHALKNSTSNYNTASGYFAGTTNTSGSIVAVGFRALYANTTGAGQTAVGYNALAGNAGDSNTAVGSSALADQLGTSNTAVGFGAMNSAARTTTQATALGVYAGGYGRDYSNSTCLGYDSAVTGENQVQLGDNRTTTYTYGAVQNRSDMRDKANIRDSILGLDFINKLRPVDFQWDMRDFYRTPLSDDNGIAITTPQFLSEQAPDGSKKRSRYHHGVIAQEVQAIIEATGVDFGGFQDHSRNGGDDVMSIGYEEFIAPLIKSVQELSAKNNSLEARLLALEAKL